MNDKINNFKSSCSPYNPFNVILRQDLISFIPSDILIAEIGDEYELRSFRDELDPYFISSSGNAPVFSVLYSFIVLSYDINAPLLWPL